MKTFKQYTTEGRKWNAIKSGVKKNWRKKVALALAAGPFTPDGIGDDSSRHSQCL